MREYKSIIESAAIADESVIWCQKQISDKQKEIVNAAKSGDAFLVEVLFDEQSTLMNKLRFEERNLIQLENEINKKIEKEREDYGEEEES
jgi:uncharacterized membrane protein (DUF106 family)|tara:strand:+ start:735 stop:1004 length:270 start_codon:yes stop_codon:yes gene_type:complete